MTEGRTINTGGGDYREINVSNSGQYAEGDIINHLSGAQQQTLAEAAAEIQELLEQLGKTYGIDTPEGKTAATTAALEKIKGDGKLKDRLFSAGQAAAIKAIEKGVDHPLVAPLVEAYKDWQKTKPKE